MVQNWIWTGAGALPDCAAAVPERPATANAQATISRTIWRFFIVVIGLVS
ncbi:hypothetical protein MNKW57_07840 [Biformimicrobium ophioploci]|uniref:Uncharacterized protein n=1 Tax=Biformimicrobium ophioploci TaxID=3036711 RepID=A0ABQ6LWJ4_9GAMM|nr:hypothetical protein MNKW57_07840 [Microbulbifer sp. NKW57]